MSEKRTMPNLDAKKASSVSKMANKLEGMIDGSYPALILRTKPGEPANQDQDIKVIEKALRSLGYPYSYDPYQPTKQQLREGTQSLPVEFDEKWHFDTRGWNPGKITLPLPNHMESFILRRHLAVIGTAFVKARRAKHVAEPVRHEDGIRPYHFVRDKQAPVFEVEQEPGDRILFISIGGTGLNGSNIIHPTEHKFISDVQNTREIITAEFTDWYKRPIGRS